MLPFSSVYLFSYLKILLFLIQMISVLVTKCNYKLFRERYNLLYIFIFLLLLFFFFISSLIISLMFEVLQVLALVYL